METAGLAIRVRAEELLRDADGDDVQRRVVRVALAVVSKAFGSAWNSTESTSTITRSSGNQASTS